MSNERPRGKRQEMRAQRRKRARQQRLLIVGIIGLVALAIVGLLVLPGIREATAPVGEFQPITPTPRPMADGRSMGNPDAPVRMEVFSDFQCSACVAFAQRVEPDITDTYVAEGDVYLVFRHFPIIDQAAPGNESRQSANASMCAAEQGRFWDFHDILTENFLGANQGHFRDRRLLAFAESLGLNTEQFETCFRENRYRQDIEADIAEATRLNITGTPSVFVNGQQVAPGFVPSFDQLSEAIEAQLGQN